MNEKYKETKREIVVSSITKLLAFEIEKMGFVSPPFHN